MSIRLTITTAEGQQILATATQVLHSEMDSSVLEPAPVYRDASETSPRRIAVLESENRTVYAMPLPGM